MAAAQSALMISWTSGRGTRALVRNPERHIGAYPASGFRRTDPNLPLSREVDVVGRVTGVALRITGEEFVPIVSRRISLNCCRTKSMKSVDGSVDQNPFGDDSARHGDAEFGADASRCLFLRMSEGSRDYAGLILDAFQSRQERKVPAQTLQLQI